MTAGTRPDWENVGIEFHKEVRIFGKDMIKKIRALQPEEQVPQFLSIYSAMLRPFSATLGEVLEDEQIRDDLLPRFKQATGHEWYIEWIGPGQKAYGMALSVKDVPPFFELTQKQRGGDAFGVRLLLHDVLDLMESCLDEGRFVLPDLLDFYCRGKMELIMLRKRPEWTGMSLAGGLIFYAPQIWAAMEKNKTLDKVFQELQGESQAK